MGVWSYDFVEAQTHDGRKLRLMTLIDEFTRSPPFWSVGKPHDPMPQGPAGRAGGTPSDASTVWHPPTRRTTVVCTENPKPGSIGSEVRQGGRLTL
jgi:hypothetical protein